jgi:thermolysin
MKFGDGWGDSLDVTAHELTHAIDSETADLEYSCQSGALDESMADIFASNVDPEDWEIGEDLPNGALRDMADPESFGDTSTTSTLAPTTRTTPPATSAPFTPIAASPTTHYLMVQDIGRDAAEQIVYKAFTEKLESDSNFEDFRSAALEAAEEIYGADSSEYRGVDESFAEVGLDGTWEAPEIEGC